MDIRKYQLEAKRTMLVLEDNVLNLNHCVLGMFSEISELFEALSNEDVVNITEELGDIVFYLSNYYSFKNYELYSIKNNLILDIPQSKLPDEGVLLFDVINKLSKLSNEIKRLLYYKKPINTGIELDILNELSSALGALFVKLNIPVESTLGKNINKLRVRYPEKFTEENALNRDLKGEFDELNK